MTEVTKHFLGWDKPFLPTAAKWLQEHYLGGELGSVDDLVVLVSGNAVARRLQSILVELASKKGKAIDIPSIVTTSRFLNLIQDTNKKVASKTLHTVLTASVMRNLPREQLSPILGLNEPIYDDFKLWIEFAKEVNDVARELSVGGYASSPASWPALPPELVHQKPIDKFEAISNICKSVSEALTEEQYVTQEDQWLASQHEIQNIPKKIILLGTTDLNKLTRKIISNRADDGCSVDVVIRSPEEKEDWFDDFGCVVPEKWKTEVIDIPDNTIVVAGSPSSQANKLLEEISTLNGKYGKDEITVAVTSEESIPAIRRQLEGHDVCTRFAGGNSLLHTPEFRLLEAVAEYSRTKSFKSYASLVRHPFVGTFLEIQSSTLHELDRFHAHHMPATIGKKWFTPSDISWRVENKSLVELHEKMWNLFSPVFDSSKQIATVWSSIIRDLLLSMYGDQELDRQSRRLFSLNAIFSALDILDALPSFVVESIGSVKIETVFDLILDELQNVSIPEYPNQEAVDIVGWLEAMTDDAPCLFVVGMDSTLLNASTKSKAYLPDSLREELGLETSDVKFARDAHAVTAMLHARRTYGHLCWIVARKNTEGDPLTPNPLLLRCDDDEQLARRSLKMVVEQGADSPNVPVQFLQSPDSKSNNTLTLPDPEEIQTEPIKRMSVTAFRDYIACPYRFWLRRVLGLGEERDDVQELDYALFGSLVHGALELFGKEDSVKDSSDPKIIYDFLLKAVDVVVESLFGKYPLPTISVQAEMAKQRMKAFSVLQAEHRKGGWKIVGIEEKEELPFGDEDSPFIVAGKIDRIDKHDDGRVLVLDYKTGSTGAEEAHGTKEEWKDLQLPIYRHLAKKMGYEFDSVATGYILVGSKDTNVRFDFPKWDDAQLQVADDRFLEIVEDVKAGNYASSPATPVPRFFEDLSWICQDNGIIGNGEGDTHE